MKAVRYYKTEESFKFIEIYDNDNDELTFVCGE